MPVKCCKESDNEGSFYQRFFSQIQNFLECKDRFLMCCIFYEIFKASSEPKASPDSRTLPGVVIWWSTLTITKQNHLIGRFKKKNRTK